MAAMDSYKIIADLAEEVALPQDGIVSRTLFQDEYLKAVVFGFSADKELSEHAVALPAIMHFIRGEAQVGVGGVTTLAREGTWIHMAPNLPHSIHACTPVVMLLLLLKSAKHAIEGASG